MDRFETFNPKRVLLCGRARRSVSEEEKERLRGMKSLWRDDRRGKAEHGRQTGRGREAGEGI